MRRSPARKSRDGSQRGKEGSKEAKGKLGAASPFPVFVHDPRQSPEGICCRLSMLLFGGGVDCGRVIHRASLFPVVLSPADSQTKYAWGKGTRFSSQGAPWCQATPKSTHNFHTYPPTLHLPLDVPCSPPSRISKALLCLSHRKCWPAAWGV